VVDFLASRHLLHQNNTYPRQILPPGSDNMIVISLIALSYLLLFLVLFTLSRVAIFKERKEGEKKYDALGREF
jgi:hypothetical protein